MKLFPYNSKEKKKKERKTLQLPEQEHPNYKNVTTQKPVSTCKYFHDRVQPSYFITHSHHTERTIRRNSLYNIIEHRRQMVAPS